MRRSPSSFAIFLLVVLLCGCSHTRPVVSFRATPINLTRKTTFLASPAKYVARKSSPTSRSTTSSSTGLNMFMGSDGGLLGVGTPEVFTVLLVGYFVLGPSDLYKLVKEIGKFIQNIRTLGTDLTTTLESNMESQLQLEELRKAQRELNDAFSFRRSINTDDTEAFSTTVTSPRAPTPQDEMATAAGTSVAAATSAESTAGTGTKKKIRRRVKRKVDTDANGSVPDLEMPSTTARAETKASAADATADKYANRPSDPFVEYSAEEQAIIDQEFEKYTSLEGFDEETKKPKTESSSSSSSSSSSWYASDAGTSEKSSTPAVASPADPRMEEAAQSRFQQQLSGKWNEQVLANEDKLGPLAKVMEMLAVLEEEKVASTKRLEEEFRKRAEMEEEYYQKQRKLLEEAAANVQSAAYQQKS